MGPPGAIDLLVIGEINPDIVVSDLDPTPRFGQAERQVASITMTVGSSAVITALAASRLGLRTAFVGLAGADAFGRYMLDEMTTRGVDVGACRVLDGGATGASMILDRGTDRAILTAGGLMATLSTDDVPLDLVRRSRHMHVGSWFLQDALRPGLPALFAVARRGGVTTSLDPNWDPAERWAGMNDVLLETDVFLPNEAELLGIAGRPDIASAIEAVRSRGPSGMVVAVKRGAAGGVAAGPDGVIEAPAMAVEPIDTIGAGDAFDGGFLFGRLSGWPLSRCLSMGVACGALSTRARGGTEAQPTLAEALAVVETIQRTAGPGAAAS